MKKQVIRLTENDIKNIIIESVNKLIKEAYFDYHQSDFGDIEDIDSLDYLDSMEDEFIDAYNADEYGIDSSIDDNVGIDNKMPI